MKNIVVTTATDVYAIYATLFYFQYVYNFWIILLYMCYILYIT